MVVENTAGAQIQLIYASNDMSDARQLKIDLHASRYAYLFHQFANPATLVTSLNELVQKSGQYIPTVLVISYKFAGDTSEALLQIARIASQNFAVECVIIDLPSDAGIRRRMKDLGATIFDGNVERLSVEFTLH
jgi:hypothetical protein